MIPGHLPRRCSLPLHPLAHVSGGRAIPTHWAQHSLAGPTTSTLCSWIPRAPGTHSLASLLTPPLLLGCGEPPGTPVASPLTSILCSWDPGSPGHAHSLAGPLHLHTPYPGSGRPGGDSLGTSPSRAPGPSSPPGTHSPAGSLVGPQELGPSELL